MEADPDLAIEVVSQTDVSRQIEEKVFAYQSSRQDPMLSLGM